MNKTVLLYARRVVVVSFVVCFTIYASISFAAPQAQLASADRSPRKKLRKDFHALASDWAQGGGEYGFPFWEKAYQRWRAGSIPASMLREYTTGYRDNMKLGCKLLDKQSLKTSEGKELRKMLSSACAHRVDALQAQRKQLDAMILRTTSPADTLDAEARANLADQIVQEEAAFTENLQTSYASTREALNFAQATLESRNLKLLNEDAFM